MHRTRHAVQVRFCAPQSAGASGHCPRRSGIVTLTPALSRAALCYRSGWRRGRGSRVGRSRWNGKSWFASIPLAIREDRREQRWSNGDERPARLPLPACPGLSVPAPGEGRGEGLITFPGAVSGCATIGDLGSPVSRRIHDPLNARNGLDLQGFGTAVGASDWNLTRVQDELIPV